MAMWDWHCFYSLLLLGPRGLGAKRDISSLQARKEESTIIANLTVQVLGGHGFLSRAASLQISLICKGLVVE